ncbi:hypothetical protein [Streptomyces sp. NPDC096142]|uniref:hypothetical protein n=1 Tax=Streptomyces sp. NPDC096142 TaxID=3366077 RepID=UPI003806A689
MRQQTLTKVVEYLGTSETTGIIDGTEIRVRQPAAGRKVTTIPQVRQFGSTVTKGE